MFGDEEAATVSSFLEDFDTKKRKQSLVGTFLVNKYHDRDLESGIMFDETSLRELLLEFTDDVLSALKSEAPTPYDW